MTNKRKQLSKKQRFEVFKRDGFRCQYCGSAAPEAVLQVDHIKPVASGGGNDLLNLVTSCVDCNQGKGARELGDGSAVEKQRAQLDHLHERREQLEMVVQWRDALVSISEDVADVVIDAMERRAIGRAFEPCARRTVVSWAEKYDVQVLLDAVDDACRQYLRFDADGNATLKSTENMYLKVPRIAYWKAQGDETPGRLHYVKGILRNRFRGIDERAAVSLMRDVVKEGGSIDGLQQRAKDAHDYEQFRNSCAHFLTFGEWDAPLGDVD